MLEQITMPTEQNDIQNFLGKPPSSKDNVSLLKVGTYMIFKDPSKILQSSNFWMNLPFKIWPTDLKFNFFGPTANHMDQKLYYYDIMLV